MDQSQREIVVAALLMVTFGIAEVTTGFTHNFFGISTSMGTTSAYIGAAIGVLYAADGLLVLTMKRWAAAIGA